MFRVEGITFNNEPTTSTLTIDKPSEDGRALHDYDANLRDKSGMSTEGGALTWQDTVLGVNGIGGYSSTNVTLLTRHR